MDALDWRAVPPESLLCMDGDLVGTDRDLLEMALAIIEISQRDGSDPKEFVEGALADAGEMLHRTDLGWAGLLRVGWEGDRFCWSEVGQRTKVPEEEVKILEVMARAIDNTLLLVRLIEVRTNADQ